eukprot:COSAG01_NODE_2099_length_8429_cov_228.935414_8_plen_64_part_00
MLSSPPRLAAACPPRRPNRSTHPTVHGRDVNKIAPKAVTVTMAGGKATMTLPPYSYTVVTVAK